MARDAHLDLDPTKILMRHELAAVNNPRANHHPSRNKSPTVPWSSTATAGGGTLDAAGHSSVLVTSAYLHLAVEDEGGGARLVPALVLVATAGGGTLDAAGHSSVLVTSAYLHLAVEDEGGGARLVPALVLKQPAEPRPATDRRVRLDQPQVQLGLGLKKAQAKARDPERCAKIAASRRGRKMPKALLRKLVALRKGSRMSDEARQKMSEAQRRRGARPPKAGVPWSAQEDEWLRTLPTAEVMRRAGRTKTACINRPQEEILAPTPNGPPGKATPKSYPFAFQLS